MEIYSCGELCLMDFEGVFMFIMIFFFVEIVLVCDNISMFVDYMNLLVL